MKNGIYINHDGQQHGPYSEAQFQKYIEMGAFSMEDLAWSENFGDSWVPIKALMAAQKLASQPVEQKSPPLPRRDSEVSTSEVLQSSRRIVPALILWFFLGALGAHQFYLGNVGRAIAYIACVAFSLSLMSMRLGDSLLVIAAPLGFIVFTVGVMADLVRLVTGRMKDGKGSLVTQWT